MVSKITLFEPHFDGAQFGPTALPAGDDSGGSDETSESHESATSTDDESKSRLKTVAQGVTTFVIMFAVLYAVFRFALSGDES